MRFKKGIVCLFLISLIASSTFSSTIVFAEELSSCAEVSKKETKVFFCANGFVKEVGEGQIGQHYVYVHKGNLTEFELKLNIDVSRFKGIEQLNPNVAQWDGQSEKIKISGNGAFIINKLADVKIVGVGTPLPIYYSELFLRSDNKKVEVFPVRGEENCKNLIRITTLMYEGVRYENEKSDRTTFYLLTFAANLIQVASSAYRTLPSIDLSRELFQKLKGDSSTILNFFGVEGLYDVVNVATGSKMGSLFDSYDQQKLIDLENYVKNNFPEVKTRLFRIGDAYNLIISRHKDVDMDDFMNAILNSDHQKIGHYLGYPGTAASYFARGGTTDQTLINAWMYNEPIEPETLFAEWVFESGSSPETNRYAREYGLNLYRVDPDAAKIFAASKREWWIERINSRSGLTQAQKQAIIDYLPTVDKAMEKIEFLNKFDVSLQNDQLLLEVVSNIWGLNQEIDEYSRIEGLPKDVLQSIKEDVSQLRTDLDSLPKETLPGWRKTELLDVLESIEKRADMLANPGDPLDVKWYWSFAESDGNTWLRLRNEIFLEMEDTAGIGNTLWDNGYPLVDDNGNPSSTAAENSIREANSAASDLIDKVEDIKFTVEAEYTKKAGEATGLSRDLTHPKEKYNTFKSMIKGTLISFALKFSGTLAGKFRQFGEKYGEYHYILLADGIQIAGLAFSVYSVIGMIKGIGVLLTAKASGSLTGAIIGAVGGFIIGFIIGLIIGIIVDYIINWWYCTYIDPQAPECGCKMNPLYENKKKFGIRGSVHSCDFIRYAAYGVKDCHEETAELYAKDESGQITPVGYPHCATVDGRCFDCTTKVLLKKGKYSFTVNVDKLDNLLFFRPSNQDFLEWKEIEVLSFREDINNDGNVNIKDINAVAKGFGRTNNIKEDVNQDGIVDEFDVKFVAQAFGSNHYDEKADVNDDGKIRIEDIAQVAKKFGTKWEHRNVDVNGDNKVDISDIARVARMFGKTDYECKKPCSSYNNERDCLDGYCKWCRKCNGYKVNPWKQDKCVDLNTACGYTCGDKFTPPECGAGKCPEDSHWNPIRCDCSPKRGPP
ncbi:MAG: dockerin type I domain-containing protein [Candidatus Aenigmarchaeota archaeon]|nr:dockerin type I domain-containing protein [Candidatus Aenigmarchaeota archaeon]